MTCFLLAAMTVDGFIARSVTDRSFDWTSDEDKHFYVDSIKRARAVVMGSKTFQTFSRYPKDMRYVIYSSQPEKFVNPRPERINATATKDDPKMVLQALEEEGYSEVAICGGSSIYTMFMKAGLIDKIYLTVEPLVFGKGVPLFNEEIATKLTLAKVTNLSDQTLLLEYDVAK
nr:RibD C-terminal domain protein [uncultured bacterium]